MIGPPQLHFKIMKNTIYNVFLPECIKLASIRFKYKE